MRRHSRKREKAVVDYRHRWPTQQTLYESRELREGEAKDKPKSRRVKALEAVSIPLLWINMKIEIRDSISANTKPGKSTHPYDTGVEDTTAIIRDGGQLTSASRHTERAETSREQTPQAPDLLRKNKRVNSASSLRNQIFAPTLQRRSQLTCTPESQASFERSNEHRTRFRSILGLTKNKANMSNTSPLEGISTSLGQLSTEPESQVEESRQESWWSFKRRTSAYNGDRDTISGPAEKLMPHNKGDGSNLEEAANTRRVRNSGANGRGSGYIRDKMMKKSSERNVDQAQIAYGETEKTEKECLSPRTDTELAKTPKIPGQSKRRRRSISSSQVRASTAGTSSTPSNVATHKDVAREEWSHQTPSPMIPTQVLRLLLGPGKSPSPKIGTQLDREDIETRTSASSTAMLGRQSREGRTSGRQSMEQKNRAWIPFWVSSRPQVGLSRRDNADGASRQEDLPEPSTGEQGRITRRRWKSG
ncbi:uncharacterized protein F4817DRAFT_367366 [Daldinia loculata]|uniref:uncharacterized protein n=1 Tax=Daldinia loculata TaxID=103429 RepID=UPI0020C4AC36|nr:uncharacterized protein F4817DRAFT_367366 [Daldinia loculata]KAI1644593.1 hypothetical protein F4817DRAFT_367366 [Daldinia loculata]